MADVSLKKIILNSETGLGYYDIEIENGDLKHEDTFKTQIINSLFSEDRIEETPSTDRKGGWFGTVFLKFGSKLRLLDQTRLTPETLLKAEDLAKQALSWFVTDGYAQEVRVNATDSENKNIILEIEILRFNNDVEHYFFEIWENTAKVTNW